MDHVELKQSTNQQKSLFEPDTLQPVGTDLRTDIENEEKGPPLEISIGTVLKNERLRIGLDYGQISEMTKIRPHMLQALENEEWALLPSPIFVKGFVRSYAHAVGLDEQEAVSLYQRAAPIEPIQPKPLGKPVRARKPLSVVMILLLVAMASFYFLWKGYMPGKRTSMRSQVIHPTGNGIASVESIREVPSKAGILSPNEGKEIPVNPVVDRMGASIQREKDLAQKASAPETAAETIGIEPPNDFQKEKAETSPSAETMSTVESEIVSGPEISGLILRADVREKTWIKIFVDEQAPKEYIFSPGANPEWKAKEGLELLIGNAGGISLEFNGEQLKNLGNPGQVVRLRLPEGYRREKLQE
jgi:cytoskeleton protein RodZ